MCRLLLIALLLLHAPHAAANPLLARHLDQALALDPAFRALAAEREAATARGVALRSPFAGPAAIGGALRADTRGPREGREADLELAAPLWLPGQRSALAGSVAAAVGAYDRRIALRRLEVAGRLREAWWDVALAEAELRVARDRRATAADIARDIARRAALGDVPGTETLLGQNEQLAADLAVAQTETALRDALAAYALLTGGARPAPQGEAVLAQPAGEHPAVVAARGILAAAEARARLVAATPQDNPEGGVFARHQAGPVTEDGLSLGVRLRVPLASEGRNAPRRADAEADRRRAEADLSATERAVGSAILRARQRLAEAEAASRLARERAGVAERQFASARRALQAGEIGLFDLYRVRQLQIEAAAAQARATAEAGRARSRLNQALGVEPR